MIVVSICTSIVLCFKHLLLQIFLILCTPILYTSFKILTRKSSLIATGVRNQYLVHFTTVQIALILRSLTFIRNVLNYPLRLITPVTVSILLLSCHNRVLAPRNVVALSAESNGRGLFIPALYATLIFHFLIFFHHKKSQLQVMNTRGCLCLEKCRLFVIFVALTGITPLITNQVEDMMCKICYEEVDISYGHYRCPASRCCYIAHVRCATDKAIWDGRIMLEGYDERSEEVVDDLITDVVEEIRIGELMVASEIKHSYHDHNLRLTFSGKTKDDDSECDGCTRPISTPFYSCEQCEFFLHKDCAELPKEMPHPFHKHLLTLSNSKGECCYSWCDACHRVHQGFRYICYEGDCRFGIDIQCMLLSDTLKHPSHEHSLYLVHNEGTSCSACFKRLYSWDVAYRYMRRCDFRLDVGCATLPLTVWY
ncbi:hypothetical protein Gotur_031333, partial [Gossypium turneri]